MNEIILSEQPKDLSKNPAAAYILSLTSKNSRRVQINALNKVSEFFGVDDYLRIDWNKLTYSVVLGIKDRLAESDYALNSANRVLSAVRCVSKNAFLLGGMPEDEYQRIMTIENINGDELPAGRSLEMNEINALIQVCVEDETPSGTRDAAIIALMFASGLRREEVVNLREYNPQNGELRVHRGKNRKDRIVYLDNGAKQAVDAWLELRGIAQGPLFWPINKSGKMRNAQMTSQAVWKILEKRREQANVEYFSPHDIRRTFITTMLDHGVDIATVAKMAGHAQIQTTMRYDRRNEKAKQEAAKLLHIKYGSDE